MDSIDFHHEPPSNLTTMVVAFGGWIDTGRAATGAVRYLVQHLSAPLMAEIDPEEFVMFTHRRPTVRWSAPGIRDIRWPRSEFFMWQPSDGRTGLLLFRGREPQQRWRTYTIAEAPRVQKQNAAGTDVYGPSGAVIWNSPPLRSLIHLRSGWQTTFFWIRNLSTV